MLMHPQMCVRVFAHIFYSTVWPRRWRTDLLTIIMGQSEPFSGACEASPPLPISTTPSFFSSALAHPSCVCILDHVLSLLLLVCLVTSSHTNRGVIWTGGKIDSGKAEKTTDLVWLSSILEISLSDSTTLAPWSHPHTHYCLYCRQPWGSDYILFATCLKKSELREINEVSTHQREKTNTSTQFLLRQAPSCSC